MQLPKQRLMPPDRKTKKKTTQTWDEKLAWIEEIITVAKEADWLYSKFAEGVYADIPGLCKVASLDEIAR